MPEQTANEVTPHILSAMDSFSDAPGAVTWLCPFREYHDMVFGSQPRPEVAFFADWYLRGAVNTGMPLNSVVSTGNYLSSLKVKPAYFDETVLVTLLPQAGSALEANLIERVSKGLPVLFYGPVDHASPAMLRLLGLRITDGIDGELSLQTSLPLDPLDRRRSAHALPASLHSLWWPGKHDRSGCLHGSRSCHVRLDRAHVCRSKGQCGLDSGAPSAPRFLSAPR